MDCFIPSVGYLKYFHNKKISSYISGFMYWFIGEWWIEHDGNKICIVPRLITILWQVHLAALCISYETGLCYAISTKSNLPMRGPLQANL